MKSMSPIARAYIISVSLIGSVLLAWQMSRLETSNAPLLLLSCGAATLLQALKITGTTTRTSYNLSWIVYGFAFIELGTPAALLVILVAHLGEWVLHRYPWYIQYFNIANFSIGITLSGLLYAGLNPAWTPNSAIGVQAGLIAFALFTFVNHLLVGLAILYARNQNLVESGVFAPLTLLMDAGLLGVGAIAAIIWSANPYAIVLVWLMIYLLHHALMVPSLQRQAETDSKTGLYNTRYFNAKLNDEMARAHRFGRPLTLVMADLDRLRDINNTYGHLAGDTVIQGVATILTQHGRDYDLVARFGGEEFAILMPETRATQALPVIEAMRRAIAAAQFHISSSQSPIGATMSFGIAELDRERDDDAASLIERADQAVYRSKQMGRNQVTLADTAAAASEGTVQAPRSPESGVQRLTQDERSTFVVDQPVAEPATNQPQPDPDQCAAPPDNTSASPRQRLLFAYVGFMAILALWMAILMVRPVQQTDWLGILLFTLLAVGAEALNLEIYVKQTSISTSAAPLLAGVLLFGPSAALCMGPAIAIVSWLKYRSPLIKLFFNSTNHTIGGLLCAGIITMSGRSFGAWSLPVQLAIVLATSLLLYASTVILIAQVISLDTRQSIVSVWSERFRWLFLHYIALGIVAYALIVNYLLVGVPGILVVLVPLLILRYTQKQYIDHTEAMMKRLHAKNAELVQQAKEISTLNEEMLKLMASALDLRDPHVVSHSHQVARYAVLIAQELGLPEERMELMQQAGVLHDIGKLAISETVLFKPAALTDEEYAQVKQHVRIGADLIQSYHSFHGISGFVLHHHEHFDGSGYPDGLAGSQIPLEARILGLADAVEAMASDRPYHKGMTVDEIRAEVTRCSGTQFDPMIVKAFLNVLERQGDQIIVDSAQGVLSRFVPAKSAQAPPTNGVQPSPVSTAVSAVRLSHQLLASEKG